MDPPLRRRSIGSLEVSLIGLGCNNLSSRLDENATRRVVRAALDAGVNLFDTADVYSAGESESLLGAALGSSRADVVIATKFGKPYGDMAGGGRPAYIELAATASLRRLGTDYIDLYQMHGPDPTTPIEDSIGTLVELRRRGVIREFGVSNFDGASVRRVHRIAQAGGASLGALQNKLNLLESQDQRDGLATCAELGIGYLPWWPLATGMLTGKFVRGRPPLDGTRASRFDADRKAAFFAERNFDAVEALTEWAGRRHRSLLELAIAWLTSHSSVASVIAGASTPEQLRNNAGASHWILSDAERAEVDAIIAAQGDSSSQAVRGTS